MRDTAYYFNKNNGISPGSRWYFEDADYPWGCHVSIHGINKDDISSMKKDEGVIATPWPWDDEGRVDWYQCQKTAGK